jgi:hypothetical protein
MALWHSSKETVPDPSVSILSRIYYQLGGPWSSLDWFKELILAAEAVANKAAMATNFIFVCCGFLFI